MKRESRKVKNHGMNWIRPVKRLAIYLRDGLACAYCGDTVENEARLTLDHLRPYKSGGSNNETNLVTCCLKCNSARGARSWKDFSEQVAAYVNHGVTSEQIVSFIQKTRKRALDLKAAQALIDQRGGFSGALYGNE